MSPSRAAFIREARQQRLKSLQAKELELVELSRVSAVNIYRKAHPRELFVASLNINGRLPQCEGNLPEDIFFGI